MSLIFLKEKKQNMNGVSASDRRKCANLEHNPWNRLLPDSVPRFNRESEMSQSTCFELLKHWPDGLLCETVNTGMTNVTVPHKLARQRCSVTARRPPEVKHPSTIPRSMPGSRTGHSLCESTQKQIWNFPLEEIRLFFYFEKKKKRKNISLLYCFGGLVEY